MKQLLTPSAFLVSVHMAAPDIITVVVVEDDTAVREALRLILDGTPGFVCVDTYGSAEALLEAEPGAVDVILLDIGLPGMSGIEAAPQLKARWPRTEILIQTVYGDEARVFDAMCAGAAGYLLKNTAPGDLVDAIREVHAGGAPMSASIARQVVQFFHMPEVEADALTPREQEVLDELTEGKTNRQIAEALCISPNTVAYHIKQIYEKLHVHSRAEAVAKVLQRGPRRS